MFNKLIKSFCGLVAAICVLYIGGAAQAIEIDNGGTTLFSDNFDNDTVGALPTLSGGDIGSGYSQVSTVLANTDVENDGVSQTITPRLGNYLNIANNSVNSGVLHLEFAAQSSGTVTSRFFAYLHSADSQETGETSGSSLRVSYRAEFDTFKSSKHIYLADGLWWEEQVGATLPAGFEQDDVFVAYHDGSAYNIATLGGNPWRLVDGQDEWFEVSMSQSAGTGGNPVFTIEGQTLDAIPLAGSPLNILALELGSNGGNFAQAYVDGVEIPEPASLALLGLGGLQMWRRPRRRRTL